MTELVVVECKTNVSNDFIIEVKLLCFLYFLFRLFVFKSELGYHSFDVTNRVFEFIYNLIFSNLFSIVVTGSDREERYNFAADNFLS